MAACSEDRLDPKAEADGFYLRGQSQYLQGELDAALTSFQEVQKRQPSDPRLPAAMGEVYLAKLDLDQALQHFQKAAEAEPSRPTTWSRIGYVHALKGRRTEARQALEKAIALNPNEFRALGELAELTLKEGNVDAAVAMWARANRAAPEKDRAGYALEAAAALKNRGRRKDAIAVLQAADRLGPRSLELSSELADLLVEEGQLEAALSAYREAASRSTTDPSLWELVGELHMRLGRPEDAAAAFNASLKVEDRAVVHVALARLHLRGGQRAQADAELAHALASATGEDARESLELARLLGALGRSKEALELLRTLAAEPDQAKDASLQLELARMATRANETTVARQACARAIDAGVRRCP